MLVVAHTVVLAIVVAVVAGTVLWPCPCLR